MNVDLLTGAGEYVSTVVLPETTPPTAIVIWGMRFFARLSDGSYREGPVVTAQPVMPAAGRFNVDLGRENEDGF